MSYIIHADSDGYSTIGKIYKNKSLSFSEKWAKLPKNYQNGTINLRKIRENATRRCAK